MFIQGHLYRRRALHDRYGGQRQGGISTPSQYPLILLFTGESGEQHGYTDGWSMDGLFLYTGEGQQGDMTFVRGNAAIRDHLANGKDLHLFTQVRTGAVRYLGQMVCTGCHVQAGPDTTGQPRQMMIFELTPLSAFEEAPTGDMESLPAATLAVHLSLNDLRTKALADAAPIRMGDPIIPGGWWRSVPLGTAERIMLRMPSPIMRICVRSRRNGQRGHLMPPSLCEVASWVLPAARS